MLSKDVSPNFSLDVSKPKKKKNANNLVTISQNTQPYPKVAPILKLRKQKHIVFEVVEDDLGVEKNVTSDHVENDSSSPSAGVPKVIYFSLISFLIYMLGNKTLSTGGQYIP